MKRRILCVLIALALCLGLCPGGAFMAGAVSGTLDFTSQASDTAGAGYSWVADTRTLTLTNFTQTVSGDTESVRAIKLPADTTLVLEGESAITNGSFGGRCIEYEGTLTIQGSGVLNLNLAMPTQVGTSSSCGRGIYEKSDSSSDNILRIESGTLNIRGNAQDTGSEGYVGISGAEVHLDGGTINMVDVTKGVNATYWWVIRNTNRKLFVNGGDFYYSKSADCAGSLASAINCQNGAVSITSGQVDISGCKDGMSVASSPVSVTGGTLRIHDLVRQTAASGVVQETHAFLCGSGSSTEPEPKISLTGGNVEISGCDYILSAVNLLGMDMLEVGEGMDLRGLVKVDKYGIYPENTSLGIAAVRVYGAYTLPESLSFHEGYSGFWDVSLARGSTLTIPAGMSFDLSKMARTGSDFEISGPGDTYDLSEGQIINNGSLYLPNEPITTREIVAGINVSGDGQIQVRDRQTENTIATLYKVTYQDGSEVLKTGLSYIDGTAFPYTPEKEGYVLDGWYKEADFTAPWNFDSDKVTGDTTLYAQLSAIPVSEVTLDQTSLSLKEGETARLTATVLPENAANKAVTWTSSNPAAATVDESGNVIAVGAGSTTITVTTADGSKTAECNVTVAPLTVPVTGVTLNKPTLPLLAGTSEQLTAAVSPGNATNQAVTWASSDPAVATVDGIGNVTAVGPGSAAITVTTADGAMTAVCTVTVKETVILPDPPAGDGGTKFQLVMEPGISQVPEGLQGIEALNTPAKLETALKTEITRVTPGIPQTNTAVYDVVLLISTDGGRTWTPATRDNFPSGGLTVTLPYPAGTNSSYRFTVVHMFTTSDFGRQPGETEVFSPGQVRNTANGIQVTVTGLSPISAGWTAPAVMPETPPSGSDGGWENEDTGSAVTYGVTIEKPEHGKVTTDRASAASGNRVTLTVTPDSGYTLDTLTVTDSRGNEIKLTARGGGKYTFTMPGRDVTVRSSFAPLPEDAQKPCDGGTRCPSRAFTDLGSAEAWYHEAVDYVLKSGLMDGFGNGLFGPDHPLTRAQFAQILYNKEGRPAVTGGSTFADVATNAWCAPAVAWAVEQGIAGGYGNGLFGPDDNITREQLAVMLWRYAGSPGAVGGELHFSDAGQISGYASDALRWAVENGIMHGTGGGILAPQGLATRAQTAQMLKNLMEQ